MFKYSVAAASTRRSSITESLMRKRRNSQDVHQQRDTERRTGHHRLDSVPRSRSCQNTARAKDRDCDRGAVDDNRHWWLEPVDVMQDYRGPSADSDTREEPKELRSPRLPMLSDRSSPSGSPCSSTASTAIPGHGIGEGATKDGGENGAQTLTDGRKRRCQQHENINMELSVTLQRLFPTVEHSPSAQQVFVHLVNLRAFISPPELLQKLLQHTILTINDSGANFSKESQRQMFEHVFAFTCEWCRSVPYDFRSQEMKSRLVGLLSLSGAAKDPSAQHKVDELIAELRTAAFAVQLSRVDRYEQAIRHLEPTVDRDATKSETPAGMSQLGETAATIAQQLSHIEMERLSMIGVDELVRAVFVSSLDALGDHPPRGNVRHYVNWFNQLSALVATEILRHAHKRHRVKCIEFLIEVAKECVNVGNFNSLMAIVAGLSAQPVGRLRRTWGRVDKSKLEVLQRQLDPSGNFVNYRATLKAAIWRAEGAKPTLAERPLVIPFFGLLLKDLFLLFRKCSQPLPSGHFNQMMFAEFADQIAQLERWKRRPCPFRKCNTVLQHLLLSPVFSERSMLILSYGYESAENSAEREQLRRATTAEE